MSDCEELAVSLYPAGGFTSMTLAHEAASNIAAFTGNGARQAEIIYIGDYDPAGVLIDKDVETKLRDHLDPVYRRALAETHGHHVDDARFPLTFHRIAVTKDQIGEMDLPTKPRKQGDRRALDVKETVEAEAIPAAVMRKLLRDKVESFLPARALQVARVAEQSEKMRLFNIADACEEGRA